MWPETREKVELELNQLRRLVDTHRPLLTKTITTEPDNVELSALSAYIHSFYNGIENILKQIATDIDGTATSTGGWHTHLLRSMAISTPHRPLSCPSPFLPSSWLIWVFGMCFVTHTPSI